MTNYERYQQIKEKAKLECVGSGHGHTKYKVVSNPEKLSPKDLAIIADRGNLCFGYRVQNGLIVVHTD